MDEFIAFKNSTQPSQSRVETQNTSSKNINSAKEMKVTSVNCMFSKDNTEPCLTNNIPNTNTSNEVKISGLRQKLSQTLNPEENSALQKILESEDLEEANETTEPKKIIVYTDGSSRGNGQANSRAGVGVFWGDNDPRNISERLHGRQTNQRAEITAALRAIQTSGDDKSVLEVRTDSNYVIQSMTLWVQGWLKKGWKGVTNKDLLQELYNTVQKREGAVIWTHIRAHTGIYGNEMADRLANLGAAKTLPPGPNIKSRS